jgi:hypothetical protein
MKLTDGGHFSGRYIRMTRGRYGAPKARAIVVSMLIPTLR